MRFFLLILSFFLFNILFAQSQCIRFDVGGSFSDKPLSSLMIVNQPYKASAKTFEDSTQEWFLLINEVSQKSYRSIQKYIKARGNANHIVMDSSFYTTDPYYLITIKDGDTTTGYNALNRKNAILYFKDFRKYLKTVKDNKVRKLIYNLDIIINRIDWDGRL